MEASFLSVNVPTSWQELNDKQLLFVYTLLGQDVHVERVMLYAFLRFARLHVVRKVADGSVYILRRGKTVYPVRRDDLLYGAMQLEFIGQPSTFPVRLEHYTSGSGLNNAARGRAKNGRSSFRTGGLKSIVKNRATVVNSDLRAFPFGHYLQVENYFQAFLQSQQRLQRSEHLRSQSVRHAKCGDGWGELKSKCEECLREIASLLYPGYKGEVDTTMKFNLVAWLYGVKHLFASEFPDLFRPSPKGGEDDWPDMQAITEAEIRALNGSDITKTDAVLAADTWGALAELNAKAREAYELERIRTK